MTAVNFDIYLAFIAFVIIIITIMHFGIFIKIKEVGLHDTFSLWCSAFQLFHDISLLSKILIYRLPVGSRRQIFQNPAWVQHGTILSKVLNWNWGPVHTRSFQGETQNWNSNQIQIVLGSKEQLINKKKWLKLCLGLSFASVCAAIRHSICILCAAQLVWRILCSTGDCGWDGMKACILKNVARCSLKGNIFFFHIFCRASIAAVVMILLCVSCCGWYHVLFGQFVVVSSANIFMISESWPL